MNNLIDLTQKAEDKRTRIYDAFKEGVFETHIISADLNDEGTILYVNFSLGKDEFRTISLEKLAVIETVNEDGTKIISEIPSLDNFFKGISLQWDSNESIGSMIAASKAGKTFKISNKHSKKGNNNWNTFPSSFKETEKTVEVKKL